MTGVQTCALPISKNDLFMVFMIQNRERAMEYQRKNRAWIYDALVK